MKVSISTLLQNSIIDRRKMASSTTNNNLPKKRHYSSIYMAYDFTSIVKSGVEYQISSQNVYKPKRLQPKRLPTETSKNRNVYKP